MALGLSFITGGGFVFAAPGAVMIRGKYAPYGYYDPVQAGKEFAYISVSGAVVNLLLAIMFLVVSLSISDPLVSNVMWWSAFINIFLAGFNMIPFGPLDGAKVWKYNPVLWGIVGIPAIILFFLIRAL